MRRLQVWFLALAWVGAASLTACSGGDTATPVGGSAGADANAEPDVQLPSFDVKAPDAGGPPTDAPDSAGNDAAVVAGQFGAPCKSNADCDSAVCLPGPNGDFCSKTCADDCPTGFSCKAKQVGTDLTYLCVPAFGSLCDPCVSVADCNGPQEVGNLCIPIGNDGSFCGSKCAQAADCPAGYSCNTVTDPDSEIGRAHV